MTRIAQCQCGQVKLTCEGEPFPVVACHCQLCQRRTGAPVHIGAWFKKDDVTFEGETKEFTRTTGDAGLPVTFNFCPTCGTSVWWPSARAEGPLAGKIGIAGGCFADPDFPAPTISVYEKHRHGWISVPEDVPCFNAMPDVSQFVELLSEP